MQDGRFGRRAHHAGPRSKACRRDNTLFRDVINVEVSSRRSSFMVTINVRTAGALPMVIAARAHRSKRVGSSYFNLLLTISKRVGNICAKSLTPFTCGNTVRDATYILSH